MQGFEHLLTSSNLLNRKLEEVSGMTKEYDTISSLWARFHALMRAQGGVTGSEDSSYPNVGSSAIPADESLIVPLHDQTMAADADPNAPTGLPGTGGYKLQVQPSARKG